MSRHTARRKSKSTKKNSKKSTSKIIFEECQSYLSSKKNDVTRNAYERNLKRFINFTVSRFHVKSKSEINKEHLQAYVDFLINKGLTPSSVHTYVAPCAGWLQINLKEISKEKRKVSENIRSRSRANKYKYSAQQYDNDKYALVVNFQSKVGIRRSELQNLRLNNLKQDESGYWCVEVEKGKGGKYHLQRLLPDDVEFIKSYFNPESTEKLFKDSDFSDKMDYHKLRALQAQRAYRYYYEQLHTGDPELDKANEYRMRGELIKRWNKYNIDKRTGMTKRFSVADTFGTYKLRGDNRRFAIVNGLSTEYSRLCLYMVSLLHLSHYRLSVCMNYLLNV